MKGLPTCRLYLLRHGEVANAQEPRFNGHYDVELSPHGVEQIRCLAEALKEKPIRSIHTSNLIRTRVGAELVAAPHGLEPIACPELRELKVGIWEGLSVREINEKFPGELETRLRNIETFQVEGGESFPQLRDRVIPRFEEIVKTHSEGSVVIMGHGGVNRIILCHLLGIPLNNIFRMEQRYAAVNVIQFYENGAVVEMINGSMQDLSG